MKRHEIKSDIAWATPTQIKVHGLDLCTEIVGVVDFGQMAFLEIFARLPNANEARMFNAMMVILVEHGITPSSLATRMTYCGAPEAVQASVAAGLLGLGSVFVGSLDNAAKMLQEALPDPQASVDLKQLAVDIVSAHRGRREIIPGVGHPFHKPIDPRTPALFKVARETGFAGRHVELMENIGAEASEQYGRPLPLNVTGAMAAIASEFRLPWKMCRGLAVAARAVGLVGHIIEEMRQPMAEEIYYRIEHEATEHSRPRE
ncbi:citryl-CoA lyase [Bradyrhizobium diversitatis]|uniref:citrate synthase (unknown stereospecificity) n=1 Tax=Bradyrhizobium diversitatis TaxID=2755406 RepID=A0ABS0NVH9_9BRAD|nr:citryl-CoA lyase [Bradyrhizobium diversitatis]MBH5385014.1 citryl-CoA lyase [Bradyrhizobium diversitatis]